MVKFFTKTPLGETGCWGYPYFLTMKKKEMIPITNEENKSYKKQKVCYICKKEFSTDDDNKKYHKVRDHFITMKNLEDPLIIFAI